MADPDWRGALQAVAPTVATMLGGPMAGLAATVVGRILLGKGDDTPTSAAEAQAAIAAAVATPEGLAKLREAEARIIELQANLQIELGRQAMEDRKDARAREVAVRDATPRILAALATFAWLAMMCALYLMPVPEGNREMLVRAMGTMDALLLLAWNYYFGSSAGSARKTETMDQMTRTLAEASLSEADRLNARELARVR